MKRITFFFSIIIFTYGFALASKPSQLMSLSRAPDGDALICLSETPAKKDMDISVTDGDTNIHTDIRLKPKKGNCYVFYPLDLLGKNRRIAMFHVSGSNEFYSFQAGIFITCAKNYACAMYLAPWSIDLKCISNESRSCANLVFKETRE
jgi:hypothetical protein